MKKRPYRIVTGWILVLGVMLFPLLGIAADKPVLILADVSGSMQETSQAQENITKAAVLKELLLRLSGELSAMPCQTGIYRVRYISGDANYYEPFMPIAAYSPEDMKARIAKSFTTDYPVFNRRTPLADMLRQLDERELGNMKGNATLLLISDGRETIREAEDALNEVRRIKDKYAEGLSFHTVFIAGKEKEDKGGELLKNMAQTGGGQYFSGSDLLADPNRIDSLCALLCEGEVVVKKEMPPAAVAPEQPSEPVSEPVREERAVITDTDGDGVYDSDDECPGTPKGARVNIKGCWIIAGILFDYDKWNIKAVSYPALDEVVAVLKQNPDLKVEIQGHTDNIGSAAYNMKLSRKRAESVKSYLDKKGIYSTRLKSEGYGFAKPVVPNTTPENRALNRRVELKPIQ